jgi:hypothetical protein
VSVNQDLQISPGDTLNDYFAMSTSYRSGNYMSIPEFLNDHSGVSMSEQFLLRFDQEPDTTARLEFDLFVQLSDGSAFNYNDEVLKIK